MVTKSKAFSFKLFGFSFLIWKKAEPVSKHSGGIVSGSCKIVRLNNFIGLALPDATVKMYVSID